MTHEFGIEFEYMCYHGPETEAANIKSPNSAKWLSVARAQKPEPQEPPEKASSTFEVNNFGYLSVSVVVTSVRARA